MVLTLNNTVELEINHYNRYTDVRDGHVTANASFGLTDMSSYDELIALNGEVITDIKIESNDTVIYSLTNQNARLNRINENVYDGGVNIDVGLTFNPDEEEAV